MNGVISLVGMSGSGKSHLAERLHRELGYDLFGCDALIEQRLAPELAATTRRGVHGLGEWMGLPWAPGFAERQLRYLEAEQAVMRDTLDAVEGGVARLPAVIDTTGSVIYTGEATLQRLRDLSVVVYLELPVAAHKEMRRLYLSHPKPVVWGDLFDRKPGEDDDAALARCYELLLTTRAAAYRRIAEVRIAIDPRRRKPADLSSFIELVRNAARHRTTVI